ncbi:MAG: 16S rRNA (adenine(1518)-N(6)/adenine(1519)-N(6))-dimethyltransferase RsmA [Alphaproteobacteria bacterium]
MTGGGDAAATEALRRRIAALPPLRAVIGAHGLSARKGLGQHFLLDGNLTDKIAAAAGDLAQGTTIEVGPGPGGLTRALLSHGAVRLVAIERDVRCIAALATLVAAGDGRLELIHGDALGRPAAELGPAPRRIVANLPYNVATPLLIAWLAQPEAIARMVLMFQREVAERMMAAPGDPAYGRLSIAVQWRWTARRVFDLAPTAFVPPPKVWSTVVALEPRPEPLGEADPQVLQQVTAAAFGQRRKMLRSSLRTLGADSEALIAAAGLDPTARAETISIEGFCALARAFARLAAQ